MGSIEAMGQQSLYALLGITFTNLNYILADFAAKVLKTSAPVVPELVTENVKSVANDDLPTVFTNFSRELSPNLDANFSEKLWKWLLSHPSILKYQCRFKPDLARNSQGKFACSTFRKPLVVTEIKDMKRTKYLSTR